MATVEPDRDAPWRSGPSDGLTIVLILAGLVGLLFVASLAIGPVALAPGDIVSGLFGQGSEATNVIVRDIRLPRALLGLLIGGTLGLAGAALQGLLRNPLASPSLFGAPAAAAFGAVTVLALGVTDALSTALPIAAIGGALISVGLIILVAGANASLLVLILAGMAVSSLAGAGTALALNLSTNPFAALEIAFWLLGSLEDRSLRHVAIAIPFMALSWVLLFWDRGAFRALALGEEAAESLGIVMWQVRLRVVPGRLLVPAALAGAALLLAADVLVRLIPSQTEVKVGVVTALIGAPFFIGMILRRRRELAGVPS